MFQIYVLIAGVIVIGGVIYLCLRWMRSDAKTIGTVTQVVKDQNLDLNVVIAQRDALANKTDATKPDEILGGL